MEEDTRDCSVPREVLALLSEERLILRETGRAVTPFGGVAVFVAYLHKVAFVEKLRECMPICWRSPNQIEPAVTLTAFLMSVLVGAKRFAHANWLRGDRALHALLGIDRFPTDDTIRNLFRRFTMGNVQGLFEPLTQWQMERVPIRSEGYTLDLDSTVFERYGHQEGVFNRKFAVAPEQKASAFRRSGRSDLDWVFTIQTERRVAKDNTVAIGDRVWLIEKSRFRSTLAGCTVTIHEHLDGRVSLRYGPHVVGRFDDQERPLTKLGKQECGGKAGSVETGENQTQVSSASHTSLGISPNPRDSHFPTAPTPVRASKRKPKAAHAA